MLVLGIETASKTAGVALVDASGVRAERTLTAPMRTLEWVLPAIEGMLRDCGLQPRDLEGVAVSVGPGSFTGLRIGIATAVGWARATGVPVSGVPTLRALAANCAGALRVAAVMDARRGEIAGALFAAEGDEWRPLTEEIIAPPEAVAARFRAAGVSDEGVVFVGDALERWGELLREAFPAAHFAPRVLWAPRAAVVAALGRARLVREGGEPLWGIQPRYGRTPEFRPVAAP